MTGKLEGVEELQRNLRKWGANADAELSKLVNATAQSVRTNAVRSIQKGPASGVVYELYQPRRTHRASAPGQAPKTDTGRLASSVSVRKSGTMTAYVFTPVEYGAYLEFGTQKMAARPWLLPATEKQRAAWEKGLRDSADRAARGIQ